MTEIAQRTRLPFTRPSISESAIEAVADVLRSGSIGSGPRVVEFEHAFADYCGARHAISVTSATAGLDLALELLDLQPGDEVIVPSINWVSGPNLVELHGANVVFCDVLRDTLQIDPASVAQAMGPRTRAILPVHYAGAPCDLDALRALAPPGSGVVILEDAAPATGARLRGEPVGKSSELAVFSFHPSKNMTTCEGGMLVTCSDEHAERLRLGRFQGIDQTTWRGHQRGGRDVYQVLAPGRKYNMTDVQAVIGLYQLRDVDGFNARRAELARGYHERLEELELVRPLALPSHPDDRHAWHTFVVLLEIERLAGGRDAVVDLLEEEGIGSAIHYPAVHLQHHYARRYPDVRLPVSEWAGERVLSLPLFPQMTESDLDRVVEVLRAIRSRTPRAVSALGSTT